MNCGNTMKPRCEVKNMSNAVLISIQPKWCELIANGKKTIEVRKTRPKLETPFKCYIYCTLQGSPEAFAAWGKDVAKWNRENWGERKGKVIGEFVCDRIERMRYPDDGLVDVVDAQMACLTAKEIIAYSNGSPLYAWHISALQIYDNPKELSEFKRCDKCPYGPIERCNEHEFSCDGTYSLSRPPQSWFYAEDIDAK